MPARQVCQNFFHDALAPFHKYRQNAFAGCHHRSHQWRITDVDQHRALFTRLGSGQKNKIKRVDRLLGNESLHRDIPLIFNNIIAMLTSQLSLCVIAVDWSGYSSQEHHVLRASLLCDGCSLPPC